MKKLLNRNNLVILLFAAALTGCGKTDERKEYVVRVNDTYLTADELSASDDSTLFYNEKIREWIRTEVLFQEAVKQGITEEKSFKLLIENSKKELAASLLLKKYLEEAFQTIEHKALINFYNSNNEIFLLPYDSYLINYIKFKNEDKAVHFRNIAIESDWNKALNAFKNDSTIIEEIDKKLFYEYQVNPVPLQRIITELYPSEISIVIEEDNGFSIVQLVNKLPKGTIPELEIINKIVSERYMAFIQDSLINKYVEELVMEYDIKFKNQAIK